jgi:hypothetical protein
MVLGAGENGAFLLQPRDRDRSGRPPVTVAAFCDADGSKSRHVPGRGASLRGSGTRNDFATAGVVCVRGHARPPAIFGAPSPTMTESPPVR